MGEPPPRPAPPAESARPARPRVAVVFGGRSTEHAISCLTAASVLAALDRDRYDVVPIGITRGGRWVLEADDPGRFALTDGKLPQVDPGRGEVVLGTDPDRRELLDRRADGAARVLGRIDVVLPLLHGPWGEDGTIQGLFEMAGVRYAGAGVLASAVAMDKEYAKLVLAGKGLPVGRYVVLRPGEWATDPAGCAARVATLGYPVFVKPARGGSSIGISRVAEPAGLAAAVATAAAHDPKVLVEAAETDVREIECGVLDGCATGITGRPQTSVLAEVRVGPGHAFYDFDAKYLSEDDVELDVPADLPDPLAGRIRDLAAAAFEALSCEGLARVDFFLRRDGQPVVNELNTMPGFTPRSMFPRMWAATGVPYPALVDRLVQAALCRPAGLR